MNFGLSRVGLTVFNTVATSAVSLTNNAAAVVEAVAGFRDPVGGTDIGEAVQLAARELAASGRPGVQRIVVLLTDGRPEGHDIDADAAAVAAKAAGLRLFTIGFGSDVDPELLRRMASTADDYFFAPSSAELSGIYTEIARRIRGTAIAQTMVITDVVPLNMDYLVGSAVPPVTSFTSNVLRWDLRDVPGDLRLTYRLRPQQLGTWPTNDEARARYRDGLDTDGELIFPVPKVVVVGPSKPLFLPLVAIWST
jgi:hypothetical protein